MRLARRVGDDERWTVVALGLAERLEELVRIGAHRDLRDVDVAVAHEDAAEVLLLCALAGVGELRHRADGRRLGRLPAGVGVDLGVHDEHVEVFAGCEHMVEAAEADVVRPAVAAEHPEGFLGELVGGGEEFGREGGKGREFRPRTPGQEGLERGDEGVGGGAGALEIVEGRKPGLQRRADFGLRTWDFGFRTWDLGLRTLDFGLRQRGEQLLAALAGEGALLLDGKRHAEGEFGVVLEERVGPGGAEAALVHRVGDAWHGRAPGLRAARGVGPVDAVAEELREQLGVRRLAAARARRRELDERLAELHGLVVRRREARRLVGKREREIPVRGRRHDALLVHGVHRERLVLGEA